MEASTRNGAPGENGAPAEQHSNRLKPNSVGLWGVLFMAVATAAPITAMTGNTPIAVGYGNGIGAPAGFLFATIILSIFAIGYVAMAKHITATGAFYGFISHGLGRIIGMASGLMITMAYIVFEASLIGIFAYFANDTVNQLLDIDIAWPVFAAIMLALNSLLAFFDISLTAKVLGVFLITEIFMLGLMAFGVLLSGGGPDGIPLDPISPAEAFTPLEQGYAPGIAAGVAGLGLFFAFWSWVGFESTAMYGEESRNPKAIIPKATLIAVVGIGLFYVFVSWMAISGNGLTRSVGISGGANTLNLFFNPTREFVGEWAVTLFRILIVTGSFACGMAFHNCASRYLYALGREGFLSKRLGRTHPVHGSPYIASFTQTAIATAIVLGFILFPVAESTIDSTLWPYLGLYGLMAVLGTMAILIVQTLCSFAVIGYFRNHHPETRHWFRTFLAPLIGGLGMAFVVYLLISNLSAAAGAASETVVYDAIPVLVAGTFVFGVLWALYLRRYRPKRYEMIGRMIYDESRERPMYSVGGEGAGDGQPRKEEPVAAPSGGR